MSSFSRFAGAVTLSAFAFAPAAPADVVTDWNGAALNAIRAGNTPPPAASRNLAILHCSVYDAVNGIQRSHQRYHVNGNPSRAASLDAAASSAAHDVLVALYPTQAANFDTLNDTILNGIPNDPAKTDGIAWGQQVASEILALRSNDGASTANQPFPGSTEPGLWRPTISFGGVVRPALLSGWGNVTPFGVRAGDQFRPPAPPKLQSFSYVMDWLQVKNYGGSTGSLRTAEQTEIARFWGYGPTTATPPGHWNQIATVVSHDQGLDLGENARLFAFLNIALADAAIVSWDCKYVYNLWRPITAIQLADTDGNAFTTADPTWTPLLATPPFPEYTSGHSTFSGAAAAVLRRFFGTDRISFTVGSDDLPGVFRTYDSFSHAAQESGLSRILGGIHYQSANFWGLHTGRLIGNYVDNRLLR